METRDKDIRKKKGRSTFAILFYINRTKTRKNREQSVAQKAPVVYTLDSCSKLVEELLAAEKERPYELRTQVWQNLAGRCSRCPITSKSVRA